MLYTKNNSFNKHLLRFHTFLTYLSFIFVFTIILYVFKKKQLTKEIRNLEKFAGLFNESLAYINKQIEYVNLFNKYTVDDLNYIDFFEDKLEKIKNKKIAKKILSIVDELNIIIFNYNLNIRLLMAEDKIYYSKWLKYRMHIPIYRIIDKIKVTI